MHASVHVHVSSYTIPSTSGLQSLEDNRSERHRLVRETRKVWVDLGWLSGTCRSEIAAILDELVFGSKVMRVRGVDIGTADALSLSFPGASERVKGFVSLPQGQRTVRYKVKQPIPIDPKAPKTNEVWYDSQNHVMDQMRKLQKEWHDKLDLPYVPPPPTDTTQIVKLKWLPSKQSSPGTEEDGIWHGLFAVNVGVSNACTTLQECSLTQDWVESAFSSAFRRECKDIAAGRNSKRNPNKYLYIPAGDARTDEDPAPSEELRTDVSVHYQQGGLHSCLRHSMSSAFHAMGFAEEAKDLALEDSITGNTVVLLQCFVTTEPKSSLTNNWALAGLILL